MSRWDAFGMYRVSMSSVKKTRHRIAPSMTAGPTGAAPEGLMHASRQSNSSGQLFGQSYLPMFAIARPCTHTHTHAHTCTRTHTHTRIAACWRRLHGTPVIGSTRTTAVRIRGLGSARPAGSRCRRYAFSLLSTAYWPVTAIQYGSTTLTRSSSPANCPHSATRRVSARLQHGCGSTHADSRRNQLKQCAAVTCRTCSGSVVSSATSHMNAPNPAHTSVGSQCHSRDRHSEAHVLSKTTRKYQAAATHAPVWLASDSSCPSYVFMVLGSPAKKPARAAFAASATDLIHTTHTRATSGCSDGNRWQPRRVKRHAPSPVPG
jgi:hypothetical protein